MSMITTLEIDNWDQLNQLQGLWDELWLKTRIASYGQSFEEFKNYCSALGDDPQLKILLVLLAGKPIGIVPLIIKSVPSHWGTVRVLTYPCEAGSLSAGAIGPHPAATLNVAIKYLKSAFRNWDILDLQTADYDWLDRGRTRNALRVHGYSLSEKSEDWCAQIQLNADWDQYWSSRPQKVHEQLEFLEQRLHGMRRVRYVRYRPLGSAQKDDSPRWDLFRTLQQLCWSHQTQDAHFEAQRDYFTQENYIRELHARGVCAGSVDLNLLMIDQQTVACSYNLHHQQQVEVLRFVVDSELPQDLGYLLLKMMLNDGAALGDQSYYFNRSAAKLLLNGWSTSTKLQKRYLYYSKMSPRAQLLKLQSRSSLFDQFFRLFVTNRTKELQKSLVH